MQRIKVLIADDIAETRKVIGKILTLEDNQFDWVGEAENGEEVLRQIPICKPDVVLMDINMPVMNGLEATEKITEMYPAVLVIIMSVQAENEYLKKAMFSGAKEYIIKPINYESLVQTIVATYNKNKERVSQHQKLEDGDKNAKIITFYSAKGGVGKSVLSINSALALSRKYKKKTLLVDLDLQYGDLALMLNLQNKKTILDLVDEHQLDNYNSVAPYLTTYNEYLDVLLSPIHPEGSEYIGKESVSKLFQLFKNQYDFILVDTAVNFEETTLYVLDLSDFILMITTMELSSIKCTKLGLNVMKTLSYNDQKVKVVVNAACDKFGVNQKEVIEIFKNNLFSILPEDIKEIRTSINKGNPICNQNSRSQFSKRIEELCKKFL